MYQSNETNREEYSSLTLSQIVTKNYKAAEVFERYGLDFCCRGNKLISDACSEKGLNKEDIFTELKSLQWKGDTKHFNFNEWDLSILTDYIINKHHVYLKKMIPVIAAHTQKVASVHGENHPETIEIAKHFSVVYKDLKQHMMKEEQMLFPFIKYLAGAEQNNSAVEKPFFGTVKNPVRMMEIEHRNAGDEMFEIRNLSGNYTPPEDACNTYKVCFQELKEFEEDLHQHVHLENNILFPKAVRLEEKMFSS
ncbi:MAG TPA: iron-sulfur cluster repair di-iron protein [Ignavibacteriaceae bacterium]|nr:iron-sulfur cluster repair di-iron protein [Ignavibacteriaceae bacterium]